MDFQSKTQILFFSLLNITIAIHDVTYDIMVLYYIIIIINIFQLQWQKDLKSCPAFILIARQNHNSRSVIGMCKITYENKVINFLCYNFYYYMYKFRLTEIIT